MTFSNAIGKIKRSPTALAAVLAVVFLAIVGFVYGGQLAAVLTLARTTTFKLGTNHLVFNADGTGDVKFQDNGVDKMVFDDGGILTLTNAITASGGMATDSLPGATATTQAIGNTTSTAVSICNSVACDTVSIATNADADAVSVGDALDTVTAAGAWTFSTSVVLPAGAVDTAALANTVCLQIFSVEFDPTEAGATNDFASLVAIDVATGDASFSATEGNEDQLRVPVGVVAHNLSVQVGAAPGAGNDAWVVTLRDDAASTTLTCTIDEAATTCTDVTNAPAIAAGSLVNLLVTSAGPDADPSATTVMRISFCFGQ